MKDNDPRKAVLIMTESDFKKADVNLHYVCELFTRGFNPVQIAEQVRERTGSSVGREGIYRLLREAATKGLLVYRPLEFDKLGNRIREKFQKLQGATVTIESIDHVATTTADQLLDMMISKLEILEQQPDKKSEIHIGFSGGTTMHEVTEKLYERIFYPGERWATLLKNTEAKNRNVKVKSQITLNFQSLIATFNPEKMELCPNGALMVFKRKELKRRFPSLKINVFGLNIEPIRIRKIENEEAYIQDRGNFTGFADACKKAKNLDFIVTSAGVLNHKHSMFIRYFNKFAKKTIPWLEGQKCIGHMLVFPITGKGPIPSEQLKHVDEYGYPNTTVKLEELPLKIIEKTKVLLALPKCNECNEEETIDRLEKESLLLKRIIESGLITHLFIGPSLASKLLED